MLIAKENVNFWSGTKAKETTLAINLLSSSNPKGFAKLNVNFLFGTKVKETTLAINLFISSNPKKRIRILGLYSVFVPESGSVIGKKGPDPNPFYSSLYFLGL